MEHWSWPQLVTRAKCVLLFPGPHSVPSYWKLDIGYGGSIYTMEMGTCHKSDSQVLNIYTHIPVLSLLCKADSMQSMLAKMKLSGQTNRETCKYQGPLRMQKS